MPITKAAETADSSTPTNIQTKLPVRKPSRGAVATMGWARAMLEAEEAPALAWFEGAWARFRGSLSFG